MIELACAILVIVCYTEPAARDFLRLTPETLLKRAIVQYMEDRSIRNLMDTIQRQVHDDSYCLFWETSNIPRNEAEVIVTVW